MNADADDYEPAGQPASPAASAGGRQRGLLAALTQRRRLPAAIGDAVAGGTLRLDDAQRDYVHALLGEPIPEVGSSAASEHTPGRSTGDLQTLYFSW